MTRLSLESLERLAYAKRRPIEVDEEQGIAVCVIGRVTYYAELPAVYRDVVDGAEGLVR